MTAPCKGCADRHELCHSTCPKYLAYRAERDAVIRQREINADVREIRRVSFDKVMHVKYKQQKHGKKA
jgi:hypothetical protein